jgi:uncharacterized protein
MDLYRSRFAYLSLALISILAPLSLASALQVPPLRGRVNDLAGLLPAERARALEERLARFEKETGHQIAMLTIASLEGEDLEGFSIRVAEKWKIGKKGFDNGAILLIAKNDRKLRIEVGYGLEGVLPDAIASRIVREVIVPRFRANDFPGGIEAGLEAIMKVTHGEALALPSSQEIARPRNGVLSGFLSVFVWGLAGLLFLSAVTSGIRREVRPWARRTPAGALAGGLLGVFFAIPVAIELGLFPFVLAVLVSVLLGMILSHINLVDATAWSGGHRSTHGWGGGGFGGGFSGGGGFRGGGGGFGGGGASGSW